MALLFVIISLGIRLASWGALSFLNERSIIRNSVTGILTLGLVVLATALARRWRPTLECPELVLVPRARRSDAGLLLSSLLGGCLLLALTFVVVYAMGGIRVQWRPVAPVALGGALLWQLGATFLDASWEEFAFRGWPFSVCVQALGPHAIALGLGIAFGLAHLFNPHWTNASIASVCLAGFLLSYSMLAFRNIVVPIGLHVGWNFAQSVLTSSRYWEIIRDPNPWRSGGEWGLEGSAGGMAVTATAAVLAFIVFLVRDRRRRRLSPARLSETGSTCRS